MEGYKAQKYIYECVRKEVMREYGEFTHNAFNGNVQVGAAREIDEKLDLLLRLDPDLADGG